MIRIAYPGFIILCIFLVPCAQAQTPPSLPSTLDDIRMGMGDMHAAATGGRIAFRIWVINDINTQSIDRRTLKRYTAALNRRLKYLSAGRFSLKLTQIRFVTLTPERPLPKFEEEVIAQWGGRGFGMILGPYDGGSYVRQGVFKIGWDEINVQPFNRKALHEILHGLISPAHSTSVLSTLEQYNPVIGLDPEEARFLGWPERPAIPVDSPLFKQF